MNIQKLDHVALICSDVNASKDWYMNVLGMEWVFQGQWNNNPYFLKLGDCYIALFQSSDEKNLASHIGPRIDHFAFRAETRVDYEEIKEELGKRGIPFSEQDHEISISIYLRDPDGIKVEITTYAH